MDVILPSWLSVLKDDTFGFPRDDCNTKTSMLKDNKRRIHPLNVSAIADSDIGRCTCVELKFVCASASLVGMRMAAEHLYGVTTQKSFEHSYT